jgi:ribosomal protein L40E
MSTLKRSQKLCPKCGEKNYIRQFNCKKCHFEFPKKDKSSIQNSSIEQFFFKMPVNAEVKISKREKKSKQDNNIIDLNEVEDSFDKQEKEGGVKDNKANRSNSNGNPSLSFFKCKMLN